MHPLTLSIFYNAKCLVRNGRHLPIIQSSHNTILMMSDKLEYTFVIDLTNLI